MCKLNLGSNLIFVTHFVTFCSVSGHFCSVVDETLSVCRILVDGGTGNEPSLSKTIYAVVAIIAFVLLILPLFFIRRRSNKRQMLIEENAKKRFEIESTVTPSSFERRPQAKTVQEGTAGDAPNKDDNTMNKDSSKTQAKHPAGKAKPGELPSFLDGECKEVSL